MSSNHLILCHPLLLLSSSFSSSGSFPVSQLFTSGSLVPLHFLPLEWYYVHIWDCGYFSQQSWLQLVSSLYFLANLLLLLRHDFSCTWMPAYTAKYLYYDWSELQCLPALCELWLTVLWQLSSQQLFFSFFFCNWGIIDIQHYICFVCTT